MDKIIFSKSKLSALTHWLNVICEPNRLLLLGKIIEGVQCNCELGDSLQMAPNLISHHLAILREAGLIETERDPIDARWIYYTVNPKVMGEFSSLLSEFFDTRRIQPRQSTCGPQASEEQRLSLERMTK